MTKGEIAKNNFMQGYNCAQAVLLAFCDDLGFDEQTALMLASPFGGGIGRMREVCGTVTGINRFYSIQVCVIYLLKKCKRRHFITFVLINGKKNP